jgi:hypothetical protein
VDDDGVLRALQLCGGRPEGIPQRKGEAKRARDTSRQLEVWPTIRKGHLFSWLEVGSDSGVPSDEAWTRPGWKKEVGDRDIVDTI